MVKLNTQIDVDYFFKWFTWDDDNKSLGFALTKDSAYFYENDNFEEQPKLVEVIPISNKQRKLIKQYLFSYKDICKKTTAYYNISTEPFVYNLKGYYKNTYVNKRVVGDAASPKLRNSIFKILNKEMLQPSDYINYNWE